MSEIMEIITSVGIPTAFCIALAWYVKYKDDKTAAEFEKQRDKHEHEIQALRETFAQTTDDMRNAIDNNTRVIQELLFYLKGGANNG